MTVSTLSLSPFSVSTSPFSVNVQISQNRKSSWSLVLSRFSFSVNWGKSLLISNIALITAGIAYGFFMRLPALMVGLAGYGIFYLAVHLKVQGSSPRNTSELQAQLLFESEKNRRLEKKLEAKLQASDISKELRDDIEELQEHIKTLEAKAERLEAKKTRSTAELMKLKAQVKDAVRKRDAYNRR